MLEIKDTLKCRCCPNDQTGKEVSSGIHSKTKRNPLSNLKEQLLRPKKK